MVNVEFSRNALSLICILLGVINMGACTENSSYIDEAQTKVRLADALQNVGLASGGIRYWGSSISVEGGGVAREGSALVLRHYFSRARTFSAQAFPKPVRVFVHVLVDGARGHIQNADHDLLVQPARWPVDKVYVDEHRVVLPAVLQGGNIDFRVGLFSGKRRFAVDRANVREQDGQNRLYAGRLTVPSAIRPVPQYDVQYAETPPQIDGSGSDAVWAKAGVMSLRTTVSDQVPRALTRVRLLWDTAHVYLLFEADDPDILGDLRARDAPVYQQEAVEIFLDVKGERRDYVELQVSPLGTQFDAAFTGGARRNMRRDYNADYIVATALEGTVEPMPSKVHKNKGQPRPVGTADRRWVSEWAISIDSLPQAPAQLQAGDVFLANVFRVSKDRDPQGELMWEESAWSSPGMGDFHNVERFGELRFIGVQTDDSSHAE